MKQIISARQVTVVALIGILVTVPFVPVKAHEGHDHATTVVETPSIAELEEMVRLLKHAISLLAQIKAIQAQQAITVTPPVAQKSQVTTEDDEMTMHHEEHSHTSMEHEADEVSEVTTAEPKLVIEIEPHNGKTHAHVRYVDKPEEMFFIDSSIDNEVGIIADIAGRTGLGTDVIKSALKYMQ